MLLNLDCFDLPTIFESVVENMIITDQVSNLIRDRVIDVLLSKHCHQHQNKEETRQRRFSVTSMNTLLKSDDKDSGVDCNIPESDADYGTERNGLLGSTKMSNQRSTEDIENDCFDINRDDSDSEFSYGNVNIFNFRSDRIAAKRVSVSI